MAMLADSVEVVIGVDTHKQTHTAAVVAAPTGQTMATLTVAATPGGDQQLLELADQHHRQRVWAIESTGGYGAGLTRFLHAQAEQVVELDRPKRAARRHGAKSDPLDATRAAREALGRDQLAQPRATGPRAALSVRLAARRSAVQAATDAQRQLHALVIAAPPALRERLRAVGSTRQLVAAGREMIVVGSQLDGNNLSARPNATGLAYDPAADAWRTLPPVRLSPQASAAAWTGSGVLALDYELRVAFYDPGRNAWRRLPGAPMDLCEGYPDVAANGRVALARGCAYALWDLEAGRWAKAQRTPRNGQGRIVTAGPVFLIAGASHESSGNGLVAYHP